MKRGLGKGLDALLKNIAPINEPTADAATHSLEVSRQQNELALELIIADTKNPRKKFSQESLKALSESILVQGVLQPILVRQEGSKYVIIAGERRYLAAKLAEKTHIPAIILNPKAEDIRIISLIENIQRENLNPIELAESFNYLVENLGLTHEQIGSSLGLARATVSNTIRLTKLSDYVKQMLINQKLELGVAKLLVSLPEELQKQVADYASENGLTVSKTEAYIASLSSEITKKSKPVLDEVNKKIADLLSERLSAKVNLSANKISFTFKTDEALKKFIDNIS